MRALDPVLQLDRPLRSEAEVLAERQRADRIAFLKHADIMSDRERRELDTLRNPEPALADYPLEYLRAFLRVDRAKLAERAVSRLGAAHQLRAIKTQIRRDMRCGFGPTPETLAVLWRWELGLKGARQLHREMKAQVRKWADEIARREGVGPLPVRMLGGERVA